MADNINVTPGTGKVVATDEVIDGILGTVQVQFVKLMDGTLDSTNKLLISATGAAKVDGSASTQPISGTIAVNNFPSTQPISASSLPLPIGASTEITLAAIKAKTDNLDVLLSTRTKPADIQIVSVNNFPATQPISGSVAVSNFPSSQVVTGTFFQATQPISALSLPLPTGASTEITLAAIKVDLDKFTFTATRLLTDGSGIVQPVSGTFFQATQPVSAITLPLPSGAATSANQTTELASLASIDGKTPALVSGRQPVDGSGVTQPISTVSLPLPSGASTEATLALIKAKTDNIDVLLSTRNKPLDFILQTPCSLVISTTGVTGAGVTATLPAVASNFHYISFIEVIKYFTAANAASATPLVGTTTNLPGSLAFTFGQPLGTIGTVDRIIFNPNSPIKSSVVNTATTIVLPATTGIIWRINVYYYTSV